MSRDKRVVFNRMHRDENIIVGLDYSTMGEPFWGGIELTMGPTWVARNVDTVPSSADEQLAWASRGAEHQVVSESTGGTRDAKG